MILLSRILLLLVVIVLLIFSISNLEPVTVKLLTWQSLEMPLFLVMLFAFFLGFALAMVWLAFRSFTAPKKSRPEPVPPPGSAKKESAEKVKRSWGLGKKGTSAPPVTAAAASKAASGPEKGAVSGPTVAPAPEKPTDVEGGSQ